jgi:hypothetical protein
VPLDVYEIMTDATSGSNWDSVKGPLVDAAVDLALKAFKEWPDERRSRRNISNSLMRRFSTTNAQS